MSHPTTYAVDFDGTLCENAYPEIGAPNLPLIDKLISRRRLGAKVILWTCREGELLTRVKSALITTLMIRLCRLIYLYHRRS